MSSNVGLSTPRGSGTSGYVQRNWAFMKPRNAGYGAPYPPVPRDGDNDSGKGFRQRQPDKKILEHDRRRRIEVQVMEERERLEEANEKLLEESDKKTGRSGRDSDDDEGKEKGKWKVLSEEEIDERCEELRQKLLKELEREEGNGSLGSGATGRKGFKSYQVHELAEAKIEESERLRKALGITENRETGEISSRDSRRRRQQPPPPPPLPREWDRDMD